MYICITEHANVIYHLFFSLFVLSIVFDCDVVSKKGHHQQTRSSDLADSA